MSVPQFKQCDHLLPTISKASAVERLCRRTYHLLHSLMNANTALPPFVKKFCSSLNQTAGNSWEMTLKNTMPSICLSQWLIAGVTECSNLVLHKCDLRLFRSLCRWQKNSWGIWETLKGSSLRQKVKKQKTTYRCCLVGAYSLSIL